MTNSTCISEGYSTASSARRAARKAEVTNFDIVERSDRFFWEPARAITQVEPQAAPVNDIVGFLSGGMEVAPAQAISQVEPQAAPVNDILGFVSLPKVRSWRDHPKVIAVPAIATGARKYRGPSTKDKIIIDLALRPEGVTGKEISVACGWTSASAKIELQRIAKHHNYTAELVTKTTWRLVVGIEE